MTADAGWRPRQGRAAAVRRIRCECLASAPRRLTLKTRSTLALMFTLGVDFGTNSVRALAVRCSDGAEYGSRVIDYPSGAQGVLLDPKDGLLARQRPADYLFGLEESIKGALAEARRKVDFDASKVIGIGLDS